MPKVKRSWAYYLDCGSRGSPSALGGIGTQIDYKESLRYSRMKTPTEGGPAGGCLWID
jgi:hypothetical protein